ncbi:MAG: endonuclease MutS2 [Clostridia bacterium]|nr:endonuclease MutS2 [Oscillospiraceae bacterium]MBQ7032109.1 endonuclease MutS2 [Clostridia bacterium]
MDTLKTLEFYKIRDRLCEQAVTGAGRDVLASLVPSDDAETVRELLAETTEARQYTAKKGLPPISAVSDIHGAVKRSRVGSTLSCGELLRVAAVLQGAARLKKYADTENFEAEYPRLFAHIVRLTPCADLARRLSDAIVDENTVDSGASPALSVIRRKMAGTTEKIREILDEIIRSQTYAKVLQEQLVTMRAGRYVVPVRAEHRGALPGVVHDTSQTGSTLFVEPMRVVEANNLLHKLAAEEKEEIQRILAAFSAEVAAVADAVVENYEAICALDVIFAKGRYADSLRAVCPFLRTDGSVEIRRGRHPLLDPDTVVPIDISVGGAFDTLVITGPNTGGKTVSLKTLGLCVLMAAAGLHIPAAEGSAVSVFTYVFADIGDEQSIEQSLSTFSSHLVNIIEILRLAGPRTLALFDELGAGTDPTEGAALARAVLCEMRRKGAKTVATTHYSEIKLYAFETEGVENAACAFDVETLRPTYRLEIGALGQSNAFAIATRLGMPGDVIENARDFVTAENTRFEDVIRRLEEQRRALAEDRESARTDREKAREMKERLSRDAENTEMRRQKILDEARREARKMLQGAKAEIDARIREALAAENKKAALEKARQQVSKELDTVSDALAKDAVRPARVAISAAEIVAGTPLYLDAMGQRGTAVRPPDKDGNVEVLVGNLKIKTHISTVSAAPPEKKKPRVHTPAASRRSSDATPARMEVDLRGMTLDEAEAVAEKFIDDAVLSHLETVTIIHGKGTGVLRKGIHALLKTNRSVKSYRLGTFGEGEDGVTIVTL